MSPGIPLQSSLLLPIQRIPRYELLLSDLLKNTPVDLHPVEHEYLQKAVKSIHEISVYMNEMVRRGEEEARVLAVMVIHLILLLICVEAVR